VRGFRGTILTHEFFASLESSARDVNWAETLPPPCYTDPEFFEFEKEAIFYREWLCVGREAWLKEPGDYFACSQVGEPVVIVRNRDGVVKAMSSVCQHRAALVAEGHGKARSFRCPYHHWTYSLDGDLVSAPEMERACGFDKSKIRLPEIKLEVWLGFIFINFDLEAKPLAPRLSEVRAALEKYDLAHADERSKPPNLVSEQWNWKVRYENANDGYHAPRLHAGLVTDCFTTKPPIFPELPEDTAGYFRYCPTNHPDFSLNVTMKAALPIFPRLMTDERNRVMFLCVPPTLTMLVCCDLIGFDLFYIEGLAKMASRRGFLVAPGALSEPLFEEKWAKLVGEGRSDVRDQDRWVDGLVQTGIQSKYAARGRFSWQETGQREFSAWLVRRYQAAWKEKPWAKSAAAAP
jgi:nitrite reductase/ring-hydroxylating ferredoxin subunit